MEALDRPDCLGTGKSHRQRQQVAQMTERLVLKGVERGRRRMKKVAKRRGLGGMSESPSSIMRL